MNVILLNIIFGIIIDTFSALRESAKERLLDLHNVCFVCGYSRLDFGRTGLDFDKHLEVDHNPWKYIYFIYYMMKLGPNELNGLEQYAYDNYRVKRTSWLPIGNTVF